MSRFIQGEDRQQVTLLPECLDDFVDEDNPIRVVDAFVGELDLAALGFKGVAPAATGRPSYHPAVLLKIYIYGYLNRIQSSRRLERECLRNVELMWLSYLNEALYLQHICLVGHNGFCKTALPHWPTGEAESSGGREPNWRMKLIHFGVVEQDKVPW